jgi:hypothetical protein
MKTRPPVKTKKDSVTRDIGQSTQLSEPSREKIRQRPYELYELGGRKNGYHFDDWLEAESEVMGKADQDVLTAVLKVYAGPLEAVTWGDNRDARWL